MKKNIAIISLFAIIVIVIASAFLLYDFPRDTESLQDADANIQTNTASIKHLSELEDELALVLNSGGQISQDRYREIKEILDRAEEQGSNKEKIKYLRGILSNLRVEGAGEAQANESINSEEVAEDLLIWHYNIIDDWTSSRDPPDCPNPLVLQSFVDVDLATSALYPGQVRGGNYKSHGGFRFDNSGNDIEIRAPMEGFLWRANRFVQEGEVQYQLDILNPCGIMYRFDHLQVLPPKWRDVISKLPEPAEDSMSTNIEPPLPVTAGEILATAVGMKDNVFVDFGVYDLRQKNNNNTPDPYAICWFYLLQSPDKEKVLALPGADYESGKDSDYC